MRTISAEKIHSRINIMPPDVDFQRLPIKSWCPILDDKTFIQAQNLSNLPFAFKHIALMPDTHVGYGMPIGGVLATIGYIIPNAVGVDIGCGMIAVRLPLKEIAKDALKYIMNMIRMMIPFGWKKHSRSGMAPISKMPQPQAPELLKYMVAGTENVNARMSMGTLGGGNHFIEIQQGSDGYIWIMIHSGSRNLGKQVADYYNKVAIARNKEYHSTVPEKHELAYLPLDSVDGQNYFTEMNYCMEFARMNRKTMMAKCISAVYTILGVRENHEPPIDVCHNYARLENHFGKNVIVHRKGAISARNGETGIIPGSQGSMSYITKGKGNAESFDSCSHGAGRKLGRKQAQRELNLEDEIAGLEAKNIIHTLRSKKNLEEAPSAYKDIEEVMDNQLDLVSPIAQLRPLAVLKG